MRIALIGADGQLGRELQQRLGTEVVPLAHADVEIRDADSIEAVLSASNPDVVINTAAYNAVDRAEDEPDAAFAVNALGPRNVALACEARGIPLLHVSTDYVFSGWNRPDSTVTDSTVTDSTVTDSTVTDSTVTEQSVPYRETDCPDPQSVYAASKLAGEHLVRGACRRHFVVRTCGLYGPVKTPGSGNFVQTMLRLGSERGEVDVVNDQTCTPTSTADLARVIAALIETEAYGLYHATNSGGTTWFQFAQAIFRLAQKDVSVKPIGSNEFGAKAHRPRYSVLDNSRLAAVIGLELPPWEEALERYLGIAGSRVESREADVDDCG